MRLYLENVFSTTTAAKRFRNRTSAATSRATAPPMDRPNTTIYAVRKGIVVRRTEKNEKKMKGEGKRRKRNKEQASDRERGCVAVCSKDNETHLARTNITTR